MDCSVYFSRTIPFSHRRDVYFTVQGEASDINLSYFCMETWFTVVRRLLNKIIAQSLEGQLV